MTETISTNESATQLKSERLLSLDAYRGMVMLLLAFTAARWDWMIPIEHAYEKSPWLGKLLNQFEHVEWQGIVLWDMIQPSLNGKVGPGQQSLSAGTRLLCTA